MSRRPTMRRTTGIAAAVVALLVAVIAWWQHGGGAADAPRSSGSAADGPRAERRRDDRPRLPRADRSDRADRPDRSDRADRGDAPGPRLDELAPPADGARIPRGPETVSLGLVPTAERGAVAQVARLIDRGGPFPYKKDGAVFSNREGRLPAQPRGYYREYTVDTPGEDDRGARRIIAGANHELFYTRDHYATFVPLRAAIEVPPPEEDP